MEKEKEKEEERRREGERREEKERRREGEGGHTSVGLGLPWRSGGLGLLGDQWKKCKKKKNK